MEVTTSKQHWLIGNKWADLAAIHQPTYNIAILKRQPHPNVTQCLQQLLEHHWEAINGTGTIVDCAIELCQQMAILDKLLNTDAHALTADMITIAREFAKIAPSQTYRWRFAKIKSNMCTRYHADMNDLRLLCTYYGQGTLWLTQDNINVQALRRNQPDDLVKDPSQVMQAAPFEITVMKGALYPENTTGAIMHRSPTIEEQGAVRILFRLDTESFVSF